MSKLTPKPEKIAQFVLLVRGEKVLLSRRTPKECEILKSQIVTSGKMIDTATVQPAVEGK